MEDNTCVIIAAMLLLTALMAFAMHKGMDGVALASVIGILAYAAGFKHMEKRSRGWTP